MNYAGEDWKSQVSPGWKQREQLLFEEWSQANGVNFSRTDASNTYTQNDYVLSETQASWEHWQKERLKVKWQNIPETTQKMGYEDQPSDIPGDLLYAIYIAVWVFSLVSLAVGIGYLLWATFDPSVPFR